MAIPRIAWDYESAKPESHKAPTALELVQWVSDAYWPLSYKSQREFGGMIYQLDDGFITTVHRSSYKKNFSRNPKDDEVVGAMKVHRPNDDVTGRNVVGYWHTHINHIILQSDTRAVKERKSDDNAYRANNYWDPFTDEIVVDKIRKFFPRCVGYIISETMIGIYNPDGVVDPATKKKGTELWLPYTRREGRPKKRK